MTNSSRFHRLTAEAHRKSALAWRLSGDEQKRLFTEAHAKFQEAHNFEAGYRAGDKPAMFWASILAITAFSAGLILGVMT